MLSIVKFVMDLGLWLISSEGIITRRAYVPDMKLLD